MRATVALFVLSAVALPVRAESSIYDETQGVRAAGMGGAMRGAGTTNDTIYLNPAGMALTQRYSIDLAYGFSPFDDLTRLNASIVDSKTGPIAGAMGYTHVRGDDTGVDANLHRFYLGAAYPISQNLAVGLMGRNIRGTYNTPGAVDGARHDISLYTMDAGATVAMSQGIGIGFAMRNLVETDEQAFTPRQAALGLGFGAERFTLAADAAMDLSSDAHRLSWFTGFEYLASAATPLRFGYRREPFVKKDGARGNESSLSGGFGFASASGSLDVAYVKSLERSQNWSMIGSVKLYL